MNKKHFQICSFKQLLKNCVSFWFYFTIILNFVVGLVLKIPIKLEICHCNMGISKSSLPCSLFTR